MRFADPIYFALLLLIPLLHFWWMKRNRPARAVFPLSVPRIATSGNPLRGLFAIRYLALALLVVALARPQAAFRQTERTVSGVDILMVLDLSASMNIEDMGDRPRIELAKATMEEFIKGRQNDRIGFVGFSGEAITFAPLTLDYGLVLKELKSVKPGMLKDGTAIGDGLALAVSHLRDSKAKSRVIVLLTDGDNNVGQVDPATAGELAQGYGIKVYTIAIGREGRVRLPIRQEIAGRTITTYQWFDNALNPELLRQIAKITHGKFYRVEEEGALFGVFREIDSLEKTDIKSQEKVRYEDRYQKWLQAGALLLLIERILARGWWRLLI